MFGKNFDLNFQVVEVDCSKGTLYTVSCEGIEKVLKWAGIKIGKKVYDKLNYAMPINILTCILNKNPNQVNFIIDKYDADYITLGLGEDANIDSITLMCFNDVNECDKFIDEIIDIMNIQLGYC